MNTNYKTIILAIGLFFALSVSISAAPGELDPTFGSGGIVITRGSNIMHLDYATDMAIQPDGKIVVVGDGTLGTFNWDFAVVRYNTDGTLDTSFGAGGIAITQLTGDYDGAAAVAIQADGRIVVAGSRYNCFCIDSSFAVVRYTPDGRLDTTFNGTGIVITSVNSSRDYAHSVAIQADGRIVVAGISGDVPQNLAMVRYNTDGSLDTTFNGTGKVIAPGGGANLAIQADGKIIAAGGSLRRYNTDGTPDMTFNGTGSVPMPVGYAVAIQADGKIVLAGNSETGIAVGRYNPNGLPDTAFSDMGKVIIPIDYWSGVSSVAIQTDGKIVVAGTSAIGDLGRNFVVARLNPTGSLDTSFNGTGKVITPFCCQSFASATSIQADGKIVLAGATDDLLYDFYDFVVVRYLGGPNANARTRFDFDGDGRADISVFRPSEGCWHLNQTTQGLKSICFGSPTDKLTPADFDGDGRTDIAVYREGTWYWLNSSNENFNAFQFGLSDDVPIPADFTGDGRAELAVYRNGYWYTLNLANNQFQAVQFGLSTDKPVLGDYDSDGRTDYAVFRPSEGSWYLLRSQAGFTAIQFGIAADQPVAGDYDGDGRTDMAVFRDGSWYLLRNSQGFTGVRFGFATDVPVPADYDGDGKTDMAVFRNGDWYLRQSSSGFAAFQFGQTEDKAVPNAFIP